MECKQAELFKVLSVTSRIRIIELLREKGPFSVKEMAEALGITPSAVSQHLKVLRYAGLVRSERKGYWLPYEINQAALDRCRELITEVCTCGCSAPVGSGKRSWKSGRQAHPVTKYRVGLKKRSRKCERGLGN